MSNRNERREAGVKKDGTRTRRAKRTTIARRKARERKASRQGR